MRHARIFVDPYLVLQQLMHLLLRLALLDMEHLHLLPWQWESRRSIRSLLLLVFPKSRTSGPAILHHAQPQDGRPTRQRSL